MVFKACQDILNETFDDDLDSLRISQVEDTKIYSEDHEVITLLESILKELRVANLHLSMMTDLVITRQEVE